MPNRRTHLLSSFPVLVHDGYCLDHGLSGSCTKEMHAVRKLSVWYKPPSDFKLLSARKLKTLFQKQPSAYNRYSLLDRPRLCVNVFVESFSKIPRRLTATKTSHRKVNSYFSHSLSWLFQLTYFVLCKLTLLQLEFLSIISKFIESMSFVIVCLRRSQNVKLGIFIGRACLHGGGDPRYVMR